MANDLKITLNLIIHAGATLIIAVISYKTSIDNRVKALSILVGVIGVLLSKNYLACLRT